MKLSTTTQPAALQGLTVLQRGWLSSNNTVLHGSAEEPGAVLVDSAHVVHAAQTVALVQQALQGEDLREVVNTHLHSDHCGGNAAVLRRWACPLRIPPGGFDAVVRWDLCALSFAATGQRCERFVPSGQLLPGQALRAGGRCWQVLAAPGHDPDSVILFDDHQGVLISADALWENGFGVVFPELDGEAAFDDVARVLDLIESLDVRAVIPGHGAVFTDVPAALARARKRLAAFRAAPERHHWHATKVLLKYHLLEEGSSPLPRLLQWFASTPLVLRVWNRLGLQAFGQRALAELAASGAVVLRDGVVYND
jgi:glyoxylase-like metal-dependent hydrolase (beta-lactamase superfamily II)